MVTFCMTTGAPITELLRSWSDGDQSAGEQLMPLIYDELHRRSARLFRNEAAGHTLQPTALINEAFVRLVDVDVTWQDRTHFFALSSRLMRRLLIDHAKARSSQKRGGDQLRVTFDESSVIDTGDDIDLHDLTRALEKLQTADPRKAEIVDMHYFGGLTVAEICEVSGTSTATIGRDLRFARAWLSEAIGHDTD